MVIFVGTENNFRGYGKAKHILVCLVTLHFLKKYFTMNFTSRTVHIEIIKVLLPTDAHVFKRSSKIYIKTAPTCFGVITIIRERTI
jgi:hypothetical protein